MKNLDGNQVSLKPGHRLQLSPDAKALWFLYQLAPESWADNILLAARIRESVDAIALRKALQTLVERHDSLRITYTKKNGEPLQLIWEYEDFELPIAQIDASSWSMEELKGRLASDARRPFNLEESAFRVTLFSRDAENHILLLAGHQIAIDIWSMSVLMEELKVFYSANKSGEEVSLYSVFQFNEVQEFDPPQPPLKRERNTRVPLFKGDLGGSLRCASANRETLYLQPLSYADWMRDRQKMLAGPRGEELWNYWRQELEDASDAVLNLPTDKPRPPVQTDNGAIHSFKLDSELTGKLQKLARDLDFPELAPKSPQESEANLYTLLLAAFQILLYRYTGQKDIPVGSPFSGRMRREWNFLVGYLVNLVVLRADTSGNPTFAEFMTRMRQKVAGAIAHQDYPFGLLLEKLQPQRERSRSPIFQVMFAFPDFPLDSVETNLNWEELELSDWEIPQQEGQFDLTLEMRLTGGALGGAFKYNTDLFESGTIERMAGHFQVLLEAIASNPQTRIDQLPLLTELERQQLLVEWNDTTTEYPQDKCIHQLFEEQVQRNPDAVAVVFENEKLTYGELNERSTKLARYLRSLGVGAEVLVGICVERSIEMVVGLLGILKAGGAYVPLDPAYPTERIAYILSDAQVPVLLTQSKLLESLKSSDRNVVCLDKDWGAIADDDGDSPVNFASPESLAYVIYTSGSTGQPKGVQIAHSSLVNFLYALCEIIGITGSDRMLAVTTISFDIAALEIYLPLLVGGEIILASREVATDGDLLLSKLVSSGTTIMQGTPATWQMLVSAGWSGNARLKMLCGGEALPQKLATSLLKKGGSLWNMYGPTETTVWSTVFPVKASEGETYNSKASESIGVAIAIAKIYILDSNLQPVPIGVPGELHIGGVGLARGYLNRPELTLLKFIPNPFSNEPGERLYKTGDLVRYRPDGNIEFLGRIDNQVKIRGFRIELGEIEATLAQHEQIREAAAIAREDIPGDKRLVAYIVSDGKSPTARDLQEFLKTKLPEYMIPSAFVTLAAMPLTPNGKLNRRSLPAPEPSSLASTSTFVAPETPTEELLAAIWSEVLGLEKVGIHDNFFALGGHSLKATQAISRIRKLFSVELPVRDVFEFPTIATLGKAIETQGVSGLKAPAIVPVSREAALPLSFAQERLWFLDRLEGQSATYNIPAAWHLDGKLAVAALERGITEILRRHEVLRTTFQDRNGIPVQIVAPAAEVALPVIDLQHLPELKQTEVVQRLATEEAQRPFDLSQDSLLRVTLLRLSAESHVLLLTMHHIVSDGWSMAVFWRELQTLYRAFIREEPSPLPELPIQYADFTLWQRQWLRAAVLESQLDYWKQQLAGVNPLLELPTDRRRSPVQTFRGSRESFKLDVELARKLKQLSQRSGVTLFMTLLAAFATLLYRYSGQSDIVIGSPIANRNRSEIEPAIGFFVNTLALRIRLENNPSFASLLNRVRKVCLDAYGHREVPFEKIVDALQLERNLTHSPLFQVMFALQNAGSVAVELPGINCQKLKVEIGVAKFDLTLEMEETSTGIKGQWEYNSDLFDAARIRRTREHFQVLLAAIASNPQTPIGKLPILTESERHQLLVEWNDTTAKYPSDKCIHQLFEEQVERNPDAVAVVFENEKLTYGELNARANRLARYLQSLGVEPEVTVGIYLDRSADMVVAVMGVMKAGGAYIPLEPKWPLARLERILSSQGVGYLVTEQKYLPTVLQQQGQHPQLKHAICLDVDTPVPPPETVDRNGTRDMWDWVARQASNRVTRGGFISSYTGQPFSEAEVDEYKNHVVKLAEPYLGKGKRVLEIGCGSGEIMFAIAPTVELYVGVDPSEITQERNREIKAQKQLASLKLLTGFADEIDSIEEGPFDLIILASTVQFFPGILYLQQVIQRALDILAPSGAILLADIMDARRKEEFQESLTAFKMKAGQKSEFETKTNLDSELYLDEDFFWDLAARYPRIAEISVLKRERGFDNELGYRYDVVIEKEGTSGKRKKHSLKPQKHLWTRWHLNQMSAENLGAVANPNNTAYIIYTSGSTGVPKGVIVRHQPVVNVIDWVNKTFQIRAGDRALLLTSLCFDLSVYDIFGLLAAGGSIQVVPSEQLHNPRELVRLLERESITFWNWTPGVLHQLLEFFPSGIDSHLRLVFLSGDWIPVALPDRLKTVFPGVKVIGLGGATEAAIWSNYYPIETVDPGSRSIPYGKPIQNAKYYILDEYLNPTPVGVPGMLYIGGECLATGYDDPRKTADKFIRDPFSNSPNSRLYNTSDLARYLSDGNIEFLGRIDNQVKIRGFRIELGEIQTVLTQHPGLREVVVIAREDIPGDKRLVAYIVAKTAKTKPPTARELRNFLKAKLPEYMVPSAFVRLDAIPLTSNGKIDRRALPAPDASLKTSEIAVAERQELIAPRDAIELQLTQIWSDILNISPIGVRDNFFDLGGHSLLAVRLMTTLEQQFGKHLSIANIFAAPTIEELATLLEQENTSPTWSPLVAIQPEGSGQPFFWMPGSGGNVVYFYELARHLGSDSPGEMLRDRPFYALQPPSLDGVSAPFNSVEDIAAYYIQAIQTIQPVGPYLLGGHSFGADVAFEIAQQLQKQSEKVALLALLDHPAGLAKSTPKQLDWDDTQWLTVIGRILESLSGQSLGIDPEILRGGDRSSQLDYFKSRMEAVNLLPENSPIERVRGIIETIKADELAFLGYVPKLGYQGRITLLRTNKLSSELAMFGELPADETWGWSRFSSQPIDVHILPGNHTTILREPHVRVLADTLKLCLKSIKN